MKVVLSLAMLILIQVNQNSGGSVEHLELDGDNEPYQATKSAEEVKGSESGYKKDEEEGVESGYKKMEESVDDGYKAASREASYEDHGKGERIMKEIDDTRNQFVMALDRMKKEIEHDEEDQKKY